LPVMDETQIVNSFKYINLENVDPELKRTPIEEGFYNLRLIYAERKEYQKSAEKGGGTGDFVKFGFAVQDSDKFLGRKVYPDALFPNRFTFAVLRKIQDATGIAQEGDTDTWCNNLQTVQPTLKLKVINVPDVNYSGIPNQKNPGYNAETGDPGMKTTIDWSAGVHQAD
jgi:hypothetical protein